jgi:hypothetical protein
MNVRNTLTVVLVASLLSAPGAYAEGPTSAVFQEAVLVRVAATQAQSTAELARAVLRRIDAEVRADTLRRLREALVPGTVETAETQRPAGGTIETSTPGLRLSSR